jgi:chromosome segregation ATPase
MHIIEALKALDSSRMWTLMENSYESIVWDENDHLPRPTKEEAEMKLQELEAEEPWKRLRTTRNSTLSETDWSQTNDIGLENEVEWEVYRQALRDLPSTTEDPETPIWPEPPQVKIVKGKNIRTELSDTKADLSETKTNLQTTQTELADAKTDLEEKTYQIISLEARLAALEQKFISN